MQQKVIGGQQSAFWYDTVEILNPSDDTIFQIASIYEGCAYGSGVIVSDTTYLFGGTSVLTGPMYYYQIYALLSITNILFTNSKKHQTI